jgi:hypothetical protein
MSDKVICVCSKGDTLDQMRDDISALKLSNREIREKLFDGLSTDVPLIKKALEKLVVSVTKLEAKMGPHPDTNTRPKMPRIVGTIIIAGSIGLVIILGAIFMIITNIVTLEDIGKMIGAILERI